MVSSGREPTFVTDDDEMVSVEIGGYGRRRGISILSSMCQYLNGDGRLSSTLSRSHLG